MELYWHKYRYFPYEKTLADRELRALIDYDEALAFDDGVQLTNVRDGELASQLTYFDAFVNGHGHKNTLQSLIESGARAGRKRQSTRYSVHGLHEYKGKFNPQVARALLNIFGARSGARVLDPFCGSGTTLVEAVRLGAFAYGTDLNPLAVMIANAKLLAMRTEEAELRDALASIEARLSEAFELADDDSERLAYLRKWFSEDVLLQIEHLREAIVSAGELAPVFLVIASNLLREYSLQDPRDLRIRRRTSPIPEKPIFEVFFESCEAAITRIAAAEAILGKLKTDSTAVVRDNTELRSEDFPSLFDCAVTSPPYATALPYIDTQRLSLVWLELVSPREITALESDLIGSRELRGPSRRALDEALHSNADGLPERQASYCLELKCALSESDGFRRQAVPILLYRYFKSMADSMSGTFNVVRPNGKYALIVGHNHTTLGGNRFDIDTPAHLAEIASSVGWQVLEVMPLQAYQRYDGYHIGNAVSSESLIILEKGP